MTAEMSLLALETYCLVKEALILGDEKWLRNNPIVFTGGADNAYKHITRLFRRTIKRKLKILTPEKVSVNILIHGIRVRVWYLEVLRIRYVRGTPRPALSPILGELPVLEPTGACRIYTPFFSPPSSIKEEIEFYVPLVFILREKYGNLIKLGRNMSFASIIVYVYDFMSVLIKYAKLEKEAYEKDLAYIKASVEEKERIDVGNIPFKYVNVKDFAPLISYWEKLYYSENGR